MLFGCKVTIGPAAVTGSCRLKWDPVSTDGQSSFQWGQSGLHCGCLTIKLSQ